MELQSHFRINVFDAILPFYLENRVKRFRRASWDVHSCLRKSWREGEQETRREGGERERESWRYLFSLATLQGPVTLL